MKVRDVKELLGDFDDDQEVTGVIGEDSMRVKDLDGEGPMAKYEVEQVMQIEM